MSTPTDTFRPIAPARSFNPSSEEDLFRFQTMNQALATHRKRLGVLDSITQGSLVAATILSPFAHIKLPLAGRLCSLAMMGLGTGLAMRYERHCVFLAEARVVKPHLDWVVAKNPERYLTDKKHPEWFEAAKNITFAFGSRELASNWPEPVKLRLLADEKPGEKADVLEPIREIDRRRLPFNLTPWIKRWLKTFLRQLSLIVSI